MPDLLLVTTVCQADIALAYKRLEYLKGLGQPIKKQPLLLVNDGSIFPGEFTKLAAEHVQSNLFASVVTRKILEPAQQSEWPYSVNHAWRTTAKIVAGMYGEVFDGSAYAGWFYFEPDVTPIHKDFAAILEAQYQAQPVRQFMGAVSLTVASNKSIIRHTNGASVYPISAQWYTIPMMLTDGIPWDVAGLGEENAARRKDIPPEAYALGFGTTNFKREGNHFTATQTFHDGASKEYAFDLHEQILHHGCKDGSLMEMLTFQPSFEDAKKLVKKSTGKLTKDVLDLVTMKLDRAQGMPWKQLIKKYRISPAKLSAALKS